MRVALYHPWVYLRSGIERSFVELLSRSTHEWVIYTHHHDPTSTYPELVDADIRELRPAVSVRRSFGPLVHAAMTMARAQLPPNGERALLVSSEGLGDLVALRASAPVAAYCHTPLKIVHDQATRAALVEKDRRKAMAMRVLAPSWNATDRRAWRHYRHVFVNSTETQRRLAAARLTAGGPVEVLHPGVDLERFRPGGARRPFLLVAGRIMWQKNIELAIDTVAELVRRGTPMQLVVAGMVDEKSVEYIAALRERVATEGLGAYVEFVVEPEDDVLVDLYRSATLLLFTARNEDFGMVPLEAMACGTPVLAVDRGGPRETVLDGATGWLRPSDPSAFADVVTDVLGGRVDLDAMHAASVARAAEFGWQQFVTRIDAVMAALAAGEPTAARD